MRNAIKSRAVSCQGSAGVFYSVFRIGRISHGRLLNVCGLGEGRIDMHRRAHITGRTAGTHEPGPGTLIPRYPGSSPSSHSRPSGPRMRLRFVQPGCSGHLPVGSPQTQSAVRCYSPPRTCRLQVLDTHLVTAFNVTQAAVKVGGRRAAGRGTVCASMRCAVCSLQPPRRPLGGHVASAHTLSHSPYPPPHPPTHPPPHTISSSPLPRTGSAEPARRRLCGAGERGGGAHRHPAL